MTSTAVLDSYVPNLGQVWAMQQQQEERDRVEAAKAAKVAADAASKEEAARQDALKFTPYNTALSTVTNALNEKGLQYIDELKKSGLSSSQIAAATQEKFLPLGVLAKNLDAEHKLTTERLLKEHQGNSNYNLAKAQQEADIELGKKYLGLIGKPMNEINRLTQTNDVAANYIDDNSWNYSNGANSAVKYIGSLAKDVDNNSVTTMFGNKSAYKLKTSPFAKAIKGVNGTPIITYPSETAMVNVPSAVPALSNGNAMINQQMNTKQVPLRMLPLAMENEFIKTAPKDVRDGLKSNFNANLKDGNSWIYTDKNSPYFGKTPKDLDNLSADDKDNLRRADLYYNISTQNGRKGWDLSDVQRQVSTAPRISLNIDGSGISKKKQDDFDLLASFARTFNNPQSVNVQGLVPVNIGGKELFDITGVFGNKLKTADNFGKDENGDKKEYNYIKGVYLNPKTNEFSVTFNSKEEAEKLMGRKYDNLKKKGDVTIQFDKQDKNAMQSLVNSLGTVYKFKENERKKLMDMVQGVPTQHQNNKSTISKFKGVPQGGF